MWERLARVAWDVPRCRGARNLFQVEFRANKTSARNAKFAKVFTREKIDK